MNKMAFKSKTGHKLAMLLVLLLGSYSGWVVLWARQGAALQTVVVGSDSCHHCGMVVSDLRHAVSVLDEDKDGHPTTRHFDDVGCFLAFAHKSKRTKWDGVVHDYSTGKPIRVSEAHFAKTDILTPMGSGWVVDRRDSSKEPFFSLRTAVDVKQHESTHSH